MAIMGGGAVAAACMLCALGTIFASCGLASMLGHVPSFPQVSMCGMYAPERYVFTLGMNISAILLAILLLINHNRKFLMNDDNSWGLYSKFSAGVQLGVGLASTVCLALMGTIPVSEFPIPHVLFAAFFFALLIVFQVWNSTERICARSRTFSSLSMQEQNRSIMNETWMVAWMIVTAVSFVTWQSTGNSIVQYVAISGVMLYFSPYILELREVSLDVVTNSEEDEEVRTRLLEGGDRIAERGRRDRAPKASVAIAVVTMLVIVLALFVLIFQVGLNPPPTPHYKGPARRQV